MVAVSEKPVETLEGAQTARAKSALVPMPETAALTAGD